MLETNNDNRDFFMGLMVVTLDYVRAWQDSQADSEAEQAKPPWKPDPELSDPVTQSDDVLTMREFMDQVRNSHDITPFDAKMLSAYDERKRAAMDDFYKGDQWPSGVVADFAAKKVDEDILSLRVQYRDDLRKYSAEVFGPMFDNIVFKMLQGTLDAEEEDAGFAEDGEQADLLREAQRDFDAAQLRDQYFRDLGKHVNGVFESLFVV